jgi:hypothetical protein
MPAAFGFTDGSVVDAACGGRLDWDRGLRMALPSHSVRGAVGKRLSDTLSNGIAPEARHQ